MSVFVCLFCADCGWIGTDENHNDDGLWRRCRERRTNEMNRILAFCYPEGIAYLLLFWLCGEWERDIFEQLEVKFSNSRTNNMQRQFMLIFVFFCLTEQVSLKENNFCCFVFFYFGETPNDHPNDNQIMSTAEKLWWPFHSSLFL